MNNNFLLSYRRIDENQPILMKIKILIQYF